MSVDSREVALPKAPSRRGGSLFEIYKRGQGYWTRVGTAVGGGVVVLGGAAYLDNQLAVFAESNKVWTLYLQHLPPVALVIALGLVLYWIVGVNRKTCDFMIATEGEMKKVSWSSRRELWGSTKVVILFTLILGFLLAFVDLLFMILFSLIGVMKIPIENVLGLQG